MVHIIPIKTPPTTYVGIFNIKTKGPKHDVFLFDVLLRQAYQEVYPEFDLFGQTNRQDDLAIGSRSGHAQQLDRHPLLSKGARSINIAHIQPHFDKIDVSVEIKMFDPSSRLVPILSGFVETIRFEKGQIVERSKETKTLFIPKTGGLAGFSIDEFNLFADSSLTEKEYNQLAVIK